MYIRNLPILQRLKRDEFFDQAGKYILGAVIAGCIFWGLVYGLLIWYFKWKRHNDERKGSVRKVSF